MATVAGLRPDVFSEACPSRAVLAKLANKWSLLVIDALAGGTMRNGALLRRIGGISQKMLTETLRELEALRLVRRRSLASVPPRAPGRALRPRPLDRGPPPRRPGRAGVTGAALDRGPGS